MKRIFWFKTIEEARAFIEGVEYVNDSALEVSEPVNGSKGFEVEITDADNDDEGDDLFGNRDEGE